MIHPCSRASLKWKLGGLVVVSDDVLLFLLERALLSAALIFFSSAESLAMLSLSYSFTVSHPPGDLSAIRISLLRFLMCSIHSWNFFDGLFLDPSSIRFSTSSSVSFNSSLNRYCFSLDLYLKSLSLFSSLTNLHLCFSWTLSLTLTIFCQSTFYFFDRVFVSHIDNSSALYNKLSTCESSFAHFQS